MIGKFRWGFGGMVEGGGGCTLGVYFGLLGSIALVALISSHVNTPIYSKILHLCIFTYLCIKGKQNIPTTRLFRTTPLFGPLE